MSKRKSFFVTILVAAMLAVILVGAYRMYPKAFQAVTYSLAAVGYFCVSGLFCKWLEKDMPMQPVGQVKHEIDDDMTIYTPGEKRAYSYTEIKEELDE